MPPDGLLQVDVQALAAFNLVDEVMCATLHSHTLVKQGRTGGRHPGLAADHEAGRH